MRDADRSGECRTMEDVLATERHCEVCFDALIRELEGGRNAALPPFPDAYW